MINRAEVAKKLRAKYKERTMPGFFEPQDVYFQTLNYLKDLEECLPDGESAFTVLADLIDPTCKPHITSEILTESITKYTAECSNCGAIFGDFPTMGQAKTTHPVYCPACGARVVRDE